MDAKLIRKVTFTCPGCNTSIKFDILPGEKEREELMLAVKTIGCPKCHISLYKDAQRMLLAIYEYNAALETLHHRRIHLLHSGLKDACFSSVKYLHCSCQS